MSKTLFCAVFAAFAITTHAAETYSLNTAIYEEIEPLRAKLQRMQELTDQGKYVNGMEFIKLGERVAEMTAKANEINKDYWDNLYAMHRTTFDEIATLFLKTDKYLHDVSTKLGFEEYEKKFHEPVERVHLHLNKELFVQSEDCPDPVMRDNLNRLITLRKAIYSKFGPLDPRMATMHVMKAESTAISEARQSEASAKLEKAVSAVKAYQVGKLTKDQALLDLGAATNVNTSPNYREHVYLFQNLPNSQTVQLTLQFDPLDKLAFATVKKRNSENEGWEEVFRKGQRLD
ncbi:MAG: hypothetical protein RIQ71_1628 [Verrucomicrobiota bacterium]|jgi:hypothetical protein